MEQKQLPESTSCGRTSLGVSEPELGMGYFGGNHLCKGCGLAGHRTGMDGGSEHCT